MKILLTMGGKCYMQKEKLVIFRQPPLCVIIYQCYSRPSIIIYHRGMAKQLTGISGHNLHNQCGDYYFKFL